MPSYCRYALFAASLFVSGTASGAVLHANAEPPAGIRTALAATASGTTRWSDVSLPAGRSIGWLVPVRRGAVVQWAPGPWLDALDQATMPRILPPTTASRCPSRSGHEVTARWTAVHARQKPSPFAVQATAENVWDWARIHGFGLSSTQASRIDELYASGWQTVAIELAASALARTSATVRVTDDGGPVLPLALTGQATHDAPLTVFVIGAGIAAIGDGAANTQDIDRLKVVWGPHGSTYTKYRDDVVSTGNGALWLRESASHEALFDDAPRAGMPAIRSVVASYFDDAGCAADVSGRGLSPDALAPADLTCGDRDDLALALAGTPPVDAHVTRLVGVQPGGKLGRNLSVDVTSAPPRHVATRATGYVSCDPSKPPPTTYDPPPKSDPPDDPGPTESPPPRGSQVSDPFFPGTTYVSSDGCGGGGTVVTTDDDDDDDDYSGWDSSDSSESCSSDTSSSDSESCSGDTSSSDGWDTSDSSTCSTVRASKRRGPSPVSRLALLAAALLLPLRRRLRPHSGDRS